MTRFRMTCAVILAVLAGLAVHPTAGAQQLQEKTSESKVRVGTFDSRALAMAYYRSEAFIRQVNDLRAELEEAKAAGDVERVRQLEAYAPAAQEVASQQGFSTGSVREIMEKIEEELPQIAEEAGVSVIVSKWEVAYKSPAVELVDLTPQLVALFEPSDQVLQWIEGLQGQDPIPVDSLLMLPPEHN